MRTIFKVVDRGVLPIERAPTPVEAPFTRCVVGTGRSALEAGLEACEAFYETVNTTDISVSDAEALMTAIENLPARMTAIRQKKHVVAIMWRLEYDALEDPIT